MTRNAAFVAIAGLSLCLASCDTGPYDPSAHHHVSNSSSTGSMLSGTDTGANTSGSMDDPAIGGKFGSAGGGR